MNFSRTTDNVFFSSSMITYLASEGGFYYRISKLKGDRLWRFSVSNSDGFEMYSSYFDTLSAAKKQAFSWSEWGF